MSATFRVRDGFDLPIRRAWVLRGEILDGVIQAGMFLAFPFNDSVEMTTPIQAVEVISEGGRAHSIGLLLAYEDDLGLELWRGLTSPGEILHVTHHDPAA